MTSTVNGYGLPRMIDYFSILLTHGLIGYTAWRLLLSDELDFDPGEEAPRPIGEKGPAQTGSKRV